MHDGSYFSLTRRFTNSRNCKFNFSLSVHFSLHKSSGMPQHHAGGLICPDRQPDKLSSGLLKKAGQLDKSGWFFIVRRSPLICPDRQPDRQPDKLSSGPLKKAGQLDKSGWFFIVRSRDPPWLWNHVVWNWYRFAFVLGNERHGPMNIIYTSIQS